MIISLPFICAQRFKLMTKAQPLHVSFFSKTQRIYWSLIVDHFFDWFFCKLWGPFWICNRLQNRSTKAKKLVNFWNPDVSGLEALQVPLESRLEPLMRVLRAPKTRKIWFSHRGISHFLQILLFGTLRLLWSFLGPSWHIMALFNSKMAPNIDPKRRPTIRKNCPKMGDRKSVV